MADAVWDDESIRQRAEHLLKTLGLAPIQSFTRLLGGANNRVFRLETTSRRLLLKAYFRHPLDLRDRLAAEAALLELAWKHGVRSVPEPVAFDHVHALGLQEFVPGRKLRRDEIDETRVEQAAGFLVDVNRLRDTREAEQLPLASEACFSVDEHIAKVEQRVQRIEGATLAAEDGDLAVGTIQSRLRSLWDRVRGEVERQASRVGIARQPSLPSEHRCVSPSDFGFHNALAMPSGELRFIDFEYAGWDDPAKTICDFFCQPAIPVPLDLFDRFMGRLSPVLADPTRTLARVRLLWPMIQVKWCCILLNGWLPEAVARRRFAGAPAGADATSLGQRLESIDKTLFTAIG